MQRPPDGISPAMAEHRRLAVWWLTSAATLLVILLVFGGYFVVTTVGSFIPAHRAGCLPSDFPAYPHMTILEMDQSFQPPLNGDSGECRMRMSSKDAYDSVNSFYRLHLNAGDWRYSSYFEDIGGSSIAFYRYSRALTKGAMTIHKQGGGTPFEVQLFS
jgi:hypothetical protein